MRRFFTNIESLSNWCFRAGGALAAFSLFSMIGLITVDVIGRKFGHPTGVTYEISGYLLVIVVFLGLAYTLRTGKHIEISAVTSRLSQRARKWLKVVTSVIGLAYIGWLFWFTLKNAMLSYTLKSVSRTALKTPLWTMELLLPIGLSLLGLAIVVETIKLIKQNQEKDIGNIGM
jgi:TRAP-type C4-dicarboxylate transport system permease small subunit